jgi:hypothetical protein
MNKLLRLYDAYALKALVCFLILFTALYPKLPSVHIIRTWVYIRLEDFFILATVIIWLIQLLRRKVNIPLPLATPIALYWTVGLISVIFSIIFIGPHLLNYFPHLAALQYLRRVEYMILFFVAFSTIRSTKDVRDYIVILCVTILGVFLYGLGQRYYLSLWQLFPDFFRNYSFCFPSFQTGNEEFAKGLPLCLPEGARINSTFGGHYDLAAYLVFVLPILIGLFISIKKRIWKISVGLLSLCGIMLLLFTASRTSFLAYLLGAVAMLIFFKKKWYIIPVVGISMILLVVFSQSTAQRLLATFRISNVVVNQQGQVIGEVLPDDLKNKISKIEPPPPAEQLQVGSAIIGLPTAKVSTGSAVVKKTLSPEEVKRRKLAEGSIELSTVTGSFQVRRALVYDISFTTRFQAEWPNAWNAFMRNPLLGSGYSSITLATDNDYLRALGETGLLGLFSFILVFIVFGITMKELVPSVTSSLTRGFAFGLVGGVIGLALNAILIDVFEASKVAEAMWLLLGVGAGGLYLTKHKKVDYLKKLRSVFFSNIALYCYLILLLVAFFAASVNNFFVADDFTWLRWAASSTLVDIPQYFTNSDYFFYRPLDKTIIFFLYNFFAFRPESYHLFTLFLHLMMVVGVYKLSMKLFKQKLLAFVTAFLFLALPIHGENIYWFSTTAVTLGALFLLCAVNAYLNFRQGKSKKWYVITLLFSIFAYLTYEIAVILPLLLFCVDYFITKPKKSMKTVWEYAPFVLLIPLYALVRFLTHTFSAGGDYSYNLVHLIPNFVGNTFGYVGLFLVGKNFFPLYDFLRESLRGQLLLFGGIFIVASLLVFFIWKVGKKKLRTYIKSNHGNIFAFGIVFGLVSLLPFLGLGNIADRYLYLASVGFCLAFALVLYGLSQKFGKKYEGSVLLIMVGLLGVWYFFQLQHEQKRWEYAGEITRTTIALFRTDYEQAPQDSKLIFVNTPVKYDTVWVFPVGLEDGLWFIYQDKLPFIYKAKNISEAKQARKDAPNGHIFSFDEKGQIHVVK